VCILDWKSAIHRTAWLFCSLFSGHVITSSQEQWLLLFPTLHGPALWLGWTVHCSDHLLILRRGRRLLKGSFEDSVRLEAMQPGDALGNARPSLGEVSPPCEHHIFSISHVCAALWEELGVVSLARGLEGRGSGVRCLCSCHHVWERGKVGVESPFFLTWSMGSGPEFGPHFVLLNRNDEK
jgi:hypothetical protein